MTDSEKLYKIIIEKDIKAFKEWLEKGGNPNSIAGKPGFDGTLLLLEVVMQIDEPEDDAPLVEMMRLLIEKGADVNAVANDNDYSALYWVVSENRPAMAKLLLDAGADVDFRTDTGDTPLVVAMENECWEMVETLLAYASPETINKWGGIYCNTPLGMAFRTANLPMVELLLQHGADPQAYDPDEDSTINNVWKVKDIGMQEKIYALIEKYKKI